jgi:integrase
MAYLSGTTAPTRYDHVATARALKLHDLALSVLRVKGTVKLDGSASGLEYRGRLLNIEWRPEQGAQRVAVAGVVAGYLGKPLKKFRRSWSAVAKAAGHGHKDGPHIMRHTAATWQMQAGTLLAEAAGYLGMSPETLWNVYGHHHPDFQERAACASGKRHRYATD